MERNGISQSNLLGAFTLAVPLHSFSSQALQELDLFPALLQRQVRLGVPSPSHLIDSNRNSHGGCQNQHGCVLQNVPNLARTQNLQELLIPPDHSSASVALGCCLLSHC